MQTNLTLTQTRNGSPNFEQSECVGHNKKRRENHKRKMMLFIYEVGAAAHTIWQMKGVVLQTKWFYDLKSELLS